MDRQVRHLARVVDQLLDVSRLADGALTIRRERTDLAALVRRVVDDQRPILEAAGLTVRLDLPAGPVRVYGDPVRLAQVATNLLENAGRFTPPGGEVTVRLAQTGTRAELTVRDTGEGIPADVLRWLFEPFAQADQGLDRPRGGLGLGLALVKGVVELHGGQVRAVSGGPGRGAEFSLWLPADAGPTAAGAGAERGQTGRRVLIVEDNRDAADSLHALLTLLGHDVRVAYTGPDGVATARDWRPEVIVCDIGLPDLDGYGVAAAVRSDPATAGALLIAVTGYGQEEDRRRALAAGFDHHLTKPAPPDVLLKLLTG
jgi:CheY-like chemotaxis protein